MDKEKSNQKENLIKKAIELGKNETSYEIEESTWNGHGWDSESGYFTNDGVVRFSNTPMELFETYDEIDTSTLAMCIDCADED